MCVCVCVVHHNSRDWPARYSEMSVTHLVDTINELTHTSKILAGC